MFEQSVITAKRRPWSIAASLSLQSAFVGAAILLSLIHIDKLPAVSLPSALPPLPRAPRAIEVIATSVASRVPSGLSIQASRVFQAPTRIPTGIPRIVDDAPAVPIAIGSAITGNDAGVPGAVGIPEGITTTPPPPPPPTPVKKPEPAAAVPIGGHVLAAKLIKRVMPIYPPLAKAARISGTVRLLGVISREGTVKSLRAESGHPLLVAAALDAVRQWLYSPTLLNGQPVEVIAPIDVHFTLTQ